MATKESESSSRTRTKGRQKSSDDGNESTKKSSSKRSAPRAAARPTPSPMEVARNAAQELLQLTGKTAESITGLEPTDDGWKVEVEVVEVSRIPATTDVLALYEITAGARGQVRSYRRVRRYTRAASGEE